MEPPRAVKKRKLTDKTLPNSLLQNPDFPDSKLYNDLLEMERKLDWTMMRKKVEIQDSLSRPPQTTRTLRLFLSHTVSDQAWQTEGTGEAPNFETGQGIPAWQFKIEGRLLDPPGRSRDKSAPRKFSSFVRKLIVELDRDPALYPDANIVEWQRPPTTGVAPLDGFSIRRTGDTPTKIRVLMYLDHYPEQFKVHPDLGNIIDVKEDSRTGVITALWNYIKINGLQDKIDRRIIRLDPRLKQVFGEDQLYFQRLPEHVNRYLTPPEPVVIHYNLNPNEQLQPQPRAYDVEIKVEDSTLKARMNQVVVNMSGESAQELARYDEQIALLTQQIVNSQAKMTFLSSFATDPAGFIDTWLASQSRDLESVLGSGPSEGMTVREEELKRSEFFRLPWVEEAVAVQEGLRLASKGMM